MGVNVECVYCTSSSHSKHLGFNLADGHCACWKCGGHQATPTLARLLAIPSGEVADVLAQYESRNYVLNHLNKRIPQAKHLELPTDTFTPAEREYLRKRDFSPRFLHEKYGVVGGGIAGEWKYRIIIPLIINGKIVSWTGRTILSKKKADELKIPRYKNLSIEESCVNPKTSLFNLDNCNKSRVILTEGAFGGLWYGLDVNHEGYVRSGVNTNSGEWKCRENAQGSILCFCFDWQQDTIIHDTSRQIRTVCWIPVDKVINLLLNLLVGGKALN